MKYLLLIYTDDQAEQNLSEAEQADVWKAYSAYTASVQAQGIMVGGEALHPSNTATSVRVRDGKPLITDGPYAETKEQLGGYYMIECDELDTAIEAARRIPGAQHGTIEVRPVVDMSG